MPGARSMRVLGLIFVFWQAADGVLLNVEHEFTTDQGTEAALLDALADFLQGLALSKEHASRLAGEAVLALRHARSKERGLHAPPQARDTARALEIPGQLGALGAAVVDASQSFLLEGGVESHEAEFLSNTLIAFLENAAGLFSARLKRNASLAEVDSTVLPAEGFPVRACAVPKFFLSGQDYFRDVYEELQTVKAGDEVIIAGWQNEFKITNLLGDEADPNSTMENVLLQAANMNAQIYIQFWLSRAADFAGMFSRVNFQQVQNAYDLQQLHENIHVFLDTGRDTMMTYMWSWHIKSVVIDRQVKQPSRRTIAYVTGMDFAPTRWDTADHLRPDPRRLLTKSVDGEQPWLDAGVKIAGKAARDVRQALTSRHASYCATSTNTLSKSYAFNKAFFREYDQCVDGNQPTVNPMFPDASNAVGQCSGGYCDEKYTTTCQKIGGNNHCMCQDGTKPENKKCVSNEEQDEGDGENNTCRVLLTASPTKMDVDTNMTHISGQLIKRIKEAEYSVLVDSQYFIGERGGCRRTCPQNKIVEALAEKVKGKMEKRQPFSVVIFVPGMTSNSHMPTIKTLFDQEPNEGLYTKIKRLAANHSLEWSDYVTVNNPMKIVNLDYLTQHYGKDYLSKVSKVPGDKRAEVPTESEVSAYTPFDHSKFYIVDGKYAIVGSANLNDRSMMAPKGDAEISVEVVGPAALDLLEQALLRYTGKPGLGARGQSEGLAKEVHQIAMENNKELERLFGMDFAAGAWTRERGDGLKETCCCKAVEEPACTDMKAKFSDNLCCKLLAGTECVLSSTASSMDDYTDKADKTACIPPALFPGSDLKPASDEFVAFIKGKVLRVQADPSKLRWQGVIIPETERLWFNVGDSYWDSVINTAWILREAVN